MSLNVFDMNSWLIALYALAAFASVGWVISLLRKDVSIVDSMWSLMFLIATATYALMADSPGIRAVLLTMLVAIWAVRLAAHITWRNWGEEEDYRYQKIRENNSPNFELKSLYIVFGLQATLAWIISIPLLVAISGDAALGYLDIAGVLLWLVGFIFEAVGDFQLAKFKSGPASKGHVMQTGLWQFTRHPNYFGEFCIWWGFYLIAFSAGGWWSIVSPLLMTVLLLRVSGVAMLEKDIGKRRPKYADYIKRTNAFFPGPPKSGVSA
jgi:steroid 5-alpha reductase family enzyme